MLNKSGCGLVAAILVLTVQIIYLATGSFILLAGSGSIFNREHKPISPSIYIVLIDTHEYTRKVNDEVFHGLPDSHDYSKNKDFFAIYPGLYCSGKKNGEQYETDYCSHWGKQLFDLHRLWNVWGVNLIENNLVGSTPKLIFAGLVTSVVSCALTIVLWFVSLRSYWSIIPAILLSWVTAISVIATAALSHLFTSKLVTEFAQLHVTGSGKIVAKWGYTYIRTAWAGCGLALFISLLWTFIACQEHRQRRKARRSGKSGSAKRSAAVESIPFVRIVRRATGGLLGGKGARETTSYQHLGTGRDGVGESSRNGSQVDLLSRSKPDSETAYEPMRHQAVKD